MEARGYSPNKERTRYRVLVLNNQDRLFMVLVLLLAVGLGMIAFV